MTDLCFITTCRGRLAHLKDALPTFIAQPGAGTVVVDYDCPDGTADWVAANHPQVTVVRVHDKPHFEIARARNLGVQAANAQWLCFVDADNRLAPDFADRVRPLLQRGFFYRPSPRSIDASGMCICHMEDFRAIGGYDAVLQGYGEEDVDLYRRLDMLGVKLAPFPGELLQIAAHDVGLRTQNYTVKSVRLNAALNQLYCNVKLDIARLKGLSHIPEDRRARLYAQVSEGVLKAYAAGQDLTFRIAVAQQRTNLKTELTTALEYHLRLTALPQNAPQNAPHNAPHNAPQAAKAP